VGEARAAASTPSLSGVQLAYWVALIDLLWFALKACGGGGDRPGRRPELTDESAAREGERSRGTRERRSFLSSLRGWRCEITRRAGLGNGTGSSDVEERSQVSYSTPIFLPLNCVIKAKTI
jgi:hypothetical protein